MFRYKRKMGHKNAYFLVNGVRCNLLFVSSQIPKSNGEDEMDRNNLRWRKNALRALVPQIRRLQCWGAVHVGVTELAGVERCDKARACSRPDFTSHPKFDVIGFNRQETDGTATWV